MTEPCRFAGRRWATPKTHRTATDQASGPSSAPRGRGHLIWVVVTGKGHFLNGWSCGGRGGCWLNLPLIQKCFPQSTVLPLILRGTTNIRVFFVIEAIERVVYDCKTSDPSAESSFKGVLL